MGHALVTGVLGALVIAAGASHANAACVDPGPLMNRSHGSVAPITPGIPTIAALPGRAPVDGNASIVGSWQFTIVSSGNNVAPFFIPDGARLDAGYAQWQSDGTEIMNSSRDPATTNFCLGVWESRDARTYKLNHFALSWDNTGTLCAPPAGASSCLAGVTNVREEVTVDPHGTTYSGTVTIDQYDPDGTPLFRLKGSISAQRIAAD
jgi:hypothetical protein